MESVFALKNSFITEQQTGILWFFPGYPPTMRCNSPDVIMHSDFPSRSCSERKFLSAFLKSAFEADGRGFRFFSSPTRAVTAAVSVSSNRRMSDMTFCLLMGSREMFASTVFFPVTRNSTDTFRAFAMSTAFSAFGNDF